MRKKIRHVLIDKGWTIEDLAKKLGYSYSHVNNIIQGRSDGTQKFWDTFKKVLNIPDSEIESYRKKE